MITVHLPPDLAAAFRTSATQRLEARSVSELVAELEAKHPGMERWLTEVDGCFRRHLLVFVGGERLEAYPERPAPLAADEEVWVLRAVSGG